MTEPDAAEVVCHSGYTYAQDPRSFVWKGQRTQIADIVARWRVPGGLAFRVRVESGELFDLHYDEPSDRWTIVSPAERESR